LKKVRAVALMLSGKFQSSAISRILHSKYNRSSASCSALRASLAPRRRTEAAGDEAKEEEEEEEEEEDEDDEDGEDDEEGKEDEESTSIMDTAYGDSRS